MAYQDYQVCLVVQVIVVRKDIRIIKVIKVIAVVGVIRDIGIITIYSYSYAPCWLLGILGLLGLSSPTPSPMPVTPRLDRNLNNFTNVKKLLDMELDNHSQAQ